MKDVFNYIKQYQDQTFDEMPPTEVDYLLINEITYLPIDACFNENDRLSLAQVWDLCKGQDTPLHLTNRFLATKDRVALLELVANSMRYGSIIISNFDHQLDPDSHIQFCAITYSLSPDLHLVSFRGTDDSMVGWAEDFMLTYEETIPAQKAAAIYLGKILSKFKGKILISGHSKGGNLALFAGLEHVDQFKDKIQHLYLFDAPGLAKTYINKPTYQDIKAITSRYLPDDSLVGRMMYADIPPIIIKSNFFNLLQHNIMNWRIDQDRLQRANKATLNSDMIETTLHQWTESHSPEELETFFTYIFGQLSNMGYHSLNDLPTNLLLLLRQIQAESKNDPGPDHDTFDRLSRDLSAKWQAVRQRQRKAQFEAFQRRINANSSPRMTWKEKSKYR